MKKNITISNQHIINFLAERGIEPWYEDSYGCLFRNSPAFVEAMDLYTIQFQIIGRKPFTSW